MQRGPAREAEVMLSHSWSEDMEQVKDLLNANVGLVLSNGNEFSLDTVIWFCCFANFQVNDWKKAEAGVGSNGYDETGPTVDEQVKLEPFKKVIGSVKDMFLLHTTCGSPTPCLVVPVRNLTSFHVVTGLTTCIRACGA